MVNQLESPWEAEIRGAQSNRLIHNRGQYSDSRGTAQLWENAGPSSYRQLSQITHFSLTTLSEATSDEQPPSLTVTYVTTCDSDLKEYAQ